MEPTQESQNPQPVKHVDYVADQSASRPEPVRPQAVMPEQLPPKNPVGGRILMWNLFATVVYFVLILGFEVLYKKITGFDLSFGGIFIYFMAYMAHAAIMLIFAIIRTFQKRKVEASAYISATVLVPLVGFGVCLLGSSLFSSLLY